MYIVYVSRSIILWLFSCSCLRHNSNVQRTSKTRVTSFFIVSSSLLLRHISPTNQPFLQNRSTFSMLLRLGKRIEIKQSNILISASFWTLECRRASTPVVSIHDVKCSQSPSGTLKGKNKTDNRVEMRRKKKTTELQNTSEQVHATTRQFSHNNRKRLRYLLSPLRRFRARVSSCSTKHSTRDLLGQIPSPLPSNMRLIRLNNCKSCSFP